MAAISEPVLSSCGDDEQEQSSIETTRNQHTHKNKKEKKAQDLISKTCDQDILPARKRRSYRTPVKEGSSSLNAKLTQTKNTRSRKKHRIKRWEHTGTPPQLPVAVAATRKEEEPPPVATSRTSISKIVVDANEEQDCSAPPGHAATDHLGPCSGSSFPEKLMNLVAWCTANEPRDREEGNPVAVRWIADGRCFQIVSIHRFTVQILPMFFEPTEYSSFTRKLYWWGFKKTPRKRYGGSDSFYHELFLRDHPELCTKFVSRQHQQDQQQYRENHGKRRALPVNDDSQYEDDENEEDDDDNHCYDCDGAKESADTKRIAQGQRKWPCSKIHKTGPSPSHKVRPMKDAHSCLQGGAQKRRRSPAIVSVPIDRGEGEATDDDDDDDDEDEEEEEEEEEQQQKEEEVEKEERDSASASMMVPNLVRSNPSVRAAGSKVQDQQDELDPRQSCSAKKSKSIVRPHPPKARSSALLQHHLYRAFREKILQQEDHDEKQQQLELQARRNLLFLPTESTPPLEVLVRSLPRGFDSNMHVPSPPVSDAEALARGGMLDMKQILRGMDSSQRHHLPLQRPTLFEQELKVCLEQQPASCGRCHDVPPPLPLPFPRPSSRIDGNGSYFPPGVHRTDSLHHNDLVVAAAAASTVPVGSPDEIATTTTTTSLIPCVDHATTNTMGQQQQQHPYQQLVREQDRILEAAVLMQVNTRRAEELGRQKREASRRALEAAALVLGISSSVAADTV